MKKYTSHRKIPCFVESQINELRNDEFKIKLEKKYKITIKND